jgi:ribosomal RNA-processing protein 36
MSSKRPVSRFREVVPVAKDSRREIRDPRFEETAGQLNSDLFKKSYAFVDELKKKEKQLMEREVHKTRSAGKKAQLQKLLLQMVSW